MSVLDSLGVDVFGLAVVFAVLIGLSLVIKLISLVIGKFQNKASAESESQTNIPDALPKAQEAQYADGELKLFDVDEKTAALIMAIVSDESKIPLSQLQFKSIRLMK